MTRTELIKRMLETKRWLDQQHFTEEEKMDGLLNLIENKMGIHEPFDPEEDFFDEQGETKP